jgi:hypothetical protein
VIIFLAMSHTYMREKLFLIPVFRIECHHSAHHIPNRSVRLY